VSKTEIKNFKSISEAGSTELLHKVGISIPIYMISISKRLNSLFRELKFIHVLKMDGNDDLDHMQNVKHIAFTAIAVGKSVVFISHLK
jgi:hypothetical protein